MFACSEVDSIICKSEQLHIIKNYYSSDAVQLLTIFPISIAPSKLLIDYILYTIILRNNWARYAPTNEGEPITLLLP